MSQACKPGRFKRYRFSGVEKASEGTESYRWALGKTTRDSFECVLSVTNGKGRSGLESL